MRLGLLSDVHSNLHALEAVLADAEDRDVDRWVFLGDAVGYNAFPAECVRLLRDLDGIAIRGNHDEAVLGGDTTWFRAVAKAGVAFSIEQMDAEGQAWLEGLPEHAALESDGVHVHFVHGSPRDPLHEYVFPSATDAELAALFEADGVNGATILCLGHTHVPLDRTVEAGRIINPGSVGQPRDTDARAAWAVLEIEDGVVELVRHRVPYDVEAAQDAIRRAGLPEMLALRLGQGI